MKNYSSFIIPINFNNGLFLIGKRIDTNYDFFGGGNEKNEEPKQTAIREFYEETNTKVEEQELIFFKKLNVKKKTIYVFFCVWKKTKNIRKINPDEHMEYRWITVNKIMKENLAFTETAKTILYSIQGFK